MTTITAGASRSTTYVSTIKGISVGWDTCGDCHEHVSRCRCDDGPVEPAYLSALRGPSDPPVVGPHQF